MRHTFMVAHHQSSIERMKYIRLWSPEFSGFFGIFSVQIFSLIRGKPSALFWDSVVFTNHFHQKRRDSWIWMSCVKFHLRQDKAF